MRGRRSQRPPGGCRAGTPSRRAREHADIDTTAASVPPAGSVNRNTRKQSATIGTTTISTQKAREAYEGSWLCPTHAAAHRPKSLPARASQRSFHRFPTGRRRAWHSNRARHRGYTVASPRGIRRRTGL
jgi:hypothetical protein